MDKLGKELIYAENKVKCSPYIEENKFKVLLIVNGEPTSHSISLSEGNFIGFEMYPLEVLSEKLERGTELPEELQLMLILVEPTPKETYKGNIRRLKEKLS